MTIGSAASLVGLEPQVPLHPVHPTRQARRIALVPQACADSAPPGRRTLQLAASDPPRGRVLLVEPDAATALELQRLLRDLGYRVVGPAASADEVERLIDRTPPDCALVDARIEGSAIAGQLTGRGIPLVWLVPEGCPEMPSPSEPAIELPARPRALATTIARAVAGSGDAAGGSWYPTPPPQSVWPRIFPQL